MRQKVIAVLVASLFTGGPAWGAEDVFDWSGSLQLGGRGTNTDGVARNGANGASPTVTITPFTGPADGAKANEYQDVRSGVIGVFDILGGSRSYYLRAFGENLGRDDMYINVRGGAYDVWKAQFYDDWIPHNLSWNALSPLANPGSTLQTGGGAYPPAQNPSTWNVFNYGTQRNTVGGNFEFSNKSPWFIRADYNEVATTGTRPSSGQLGTGSGNGLIEFGVPADYTTKNSTIEAGYSAKSLNVKLTFLDSKFSSGIQAARWTNFYMLNGLDTTLLTPDNDLQKWSLNASWRDLPLDSSLLLRVTQSKLTNSVDVASGSLKPTGNQSPPIGVGNLVTAPSSSTFEGEHKTTTATVALNSTLMDGLESRLYYQYYDLQNDSTPISYAAGGLGTAAATCPAANDATRFCISPLEAGELFGYTKNDVGIDLTYRLSPRQKLLGGFNWLKVERDFEVAPTTEDRKFWIEYRNTAIVPDLVGRLKYVYLEQRSDINHNFTDSGGATPAQVPYYFSAYDVANFDQNLAKLTLDWNPISLLNIGFGVTWRQTEYRDLQYYGRTDDTSTYFDLSIAYGDPDSLRISALGNWGQVDFHQAYRNTATGASPAPGGTQTATTFDWGTKNTQGNWVVAVMADWKAAEQLMLTGSVSWQRTTGGVDFTSGNYLGAGGYNGGPLVNYVTDNTKMFRVNLKGDYRINKNWSATLGYAYEKYEYTDDQMRGYQSYYPYYQYIPGTNNALSTNNSWYSGAFANPSYTTNLIYLTATYRFN